MKNWASTLLMRITGENAPGGREVLFNTQWLFWDRAIRSVIGLIISALVARHLGPAGYGALSYALSFVMLFSPLGDLGITSIIIRDLAKSPTGAPRLMGTAFGLRLLGGLVAAGAAIGSSHLIGGQSDLIQTLVALLSLMTVLQVSDIVDHWFQSRVESRFVIAAKGIGLAIATGLNLWLLVGKGSVIGFAAVMIVEATINAIALFSVYWRRHGSLSLWRFGLPEANSFLRDGWPLFLAGFLKVLYLRIDQILIGRLCGESEVGIYSVAVRISEGFIILPMILNSTLLPAVVASAKQSEQQFNDRMLRLYRLFAFTGYAIAIPLTFFAGPIIRLLFGAAYAPAASMLVVLSWSVLFIGLGTARGTHMIALNWTRRHAATNLLGAVFNIGLNLWLIPIYGGMGAAIASLAAYAVAAYISCFIIPSLRTTALLMTRAMIWPKFWD